MTSGDGFEWRLGGRVKKGGCSSTPSVERGVWWGAEDARWGKGRRGLPVFAGVGF